MRAYLILGIIALALFIFSNNNAQLIIGCSCLILDKLEHLEKVK